LVGCPGNAGRFDNAGAIGQEVNGVAEAEVFVGHDQPEHVALGEAKPAAADLVFLIDR
jgi:hypothetical protein